MSLLTKISMIIILTLDLWFADGCRIILRNTSNLAIDPQYVYWRGDGASSTESPKDSTQIGASTRPMINLRETTDGSISDKAIIKQALSDFKAEDHTEQSDRLNMNTERLMGDWVTKVLFGSPTVNTLRHYPINGITKSSIISVSGYWHPNDGGGGSFIWSDTSDKNDDGGAVIAPDGAKKNGRWLRLIQDQAVDARWWGAKFDSGNHPLSMKYSTLSQAQSVYQSAVSLMDEIDGLAIQNAIQYISGTGGIVKVPAGNGRISRTLTVTTGGIYLEGAGVGATKLFIASDAIDGVLFTGNFAFGGVRNLSIISAIRAPTSGSALNTVGASSVSHGPLAIKGTFNGASSKNTKILRYERVDVSQVAKDGDSFYVDGTPFVYFINTTTFQDEGAYNRAAYHIVAAQGVNMSSCTGQRAQYGLLINPALHAKVFDGFVQDCDFDNNQTGGILIDTSSGGEVYAWNFTGARTGFGAGYGVQLSGDPRLINNINFVNHTSVKNVKAGFNLLDGTGIRLASCDILGNSAKGGEFDAVSIGNVDNLIIHGNLIGSYNSDSNNQRYGIFVSSSFHGLAQIALNILSQNRRGGIHIDTESRDVHLFNNETKPVSINQR